MEDIPEGEQVLAGTFSLNGHPAIILFDSGANHDFISKARTQKSQMAIEYLPTPYMISTPKGKIFTRQVVINSPLNLGGRVYKTSLIVLEGQGIDAILGMNWMKRHRALLDTAARTIHLDSPEHGNATLQLGLTPVTSAVVHHTVA
jgi:predicted aspartyl protease